jgi:predicted PurR-regulated permease PerM
MSATELSARGTTLVSRGLIAVLLIQFFILRTPPQEERETNGFITEARKRLVPEQADLRRRLKNYQEKLENLQNGLNEIPRKDARKIDQKLQQLKAMQAERDQAFDRLTKIQADTVSLAKARVRREFKIPGTDSVIDEADIRRFYPFAIGCFLALILVFRRMTMRTALEERDRSFVPPYWMAPFGYAYSKSFGQYVGANSLGMLQIGALGYLYYQFMHRDGVFQSSTLFLGNSD